MLQKLIQLKSHLLNYAQSITRSREDAEDIVQETMLRVWNYSKRDKLENLKAFSMRITRNLSLDKVKSNKKNREKKSLINTHDRDNPHSITAQKETMDFIEEVLLQLPDKQSKIFQLRDIEGYSYKEIAIELNIPENQVKVNLHRARKFIRQQLESRDAYGI